jgi:hypothetical protein
MQAVARLQQTAEAGSRQQIVESREKTAERSRETAECGDQKAESRFCRSEQIPKNKEYEAGKIVQKVET